MQYVPCFDVEAFKVESGKIIADMRAGQNYLSKLDLRAFCKTHSWEETGEVFVGRVNPTVSAGK
jgi:alpha-galactosidase